MACQLKSSFFLQVYLKITVSCAYLLVQTQFHIIKDLYFIQSSVQATIVLLITEMSQEAIGKKNIHEWKTSGELQDWIVNLETLENFFLISKRNLLALSQSWDRGIRVIRKVTRFGGENGQFQHDRASSVFVQLL
jgi:hypothetical protein